MPCSKRLNRLDALRSDRSSTHREGFEPALQGKSHTFEETSVDHVGGRIRIENSMKIRRKSQSASNVPRPPKNILAPCVSALGDRFFG